MLFAFLIFTSTKQRYFLFLTIRSISPNRQEKLKSTSEYFFFSKNSAAFISASFPNAFIYSAPFLKRIFCEFHRSRIVQFFHNAVSCRSLCVFQNRTAEI